MREVRFGNSTSSGLYPTVYGTVLDGLFCRSAKGAIRLTIHDLRQLPCGRFRRGVKYSAPATRTNIAMMRHDAPTVAANGLYLFFPDGYSVTLNTAFVETRSREILMERERATPEMRQATAFQLCSVCPKRGNADTCHAIQPILAASECIDLYPSYMPVTAVFRTSHNGRGAYTITAETELQRALQYVSLLSLLYYCEVGREYWRYFHGIHPLMDVEDIVVRMYLNIFWSCGGSREQTRALISRFHDQIAVTTQCQVDRLRLICQSDALLNALVLTQTASEFLVDRVESLVAQHIHEFGQSYFQ